MQNAGVNHAQTMGLFADWAQLVSLLLLLKDASNSDIIDSLNDQNAKFLIKIIEQNELIIKQNEQILRKLGEK